MKNKNSVFKKTLAVLLTALLVFGTVSLGIVFPDTKITAKALDSVGKLAFYVPEAVYLYPNVTSWKDSTATPFQFFITNTVDTSSIYTQPTVKTATVTTDTIYFAYEKITGTPTISYKWIDKSGNVKSTSDGAVNFCGTAKASGVVGTMTAESGGYFTASLSAENSKSPTLTSSETGCYIQWTVSYTDSTDGRSKEAYAYTYVYKPNVQSVGGAIRIKNTKGTNSFAQQLTWLTGIHSVSGEGSYFANYTTTSAGKGLAPFLSSQSTGYVGDTSVTGVMPQQTSSYDQSNGATSMYAVFATETNTTAYFTANQANSTFGNVGSKDWLNNNDNDKDSGFGAKTYSYRSIEKDAGGVVWKDSYVHNNVLSTAIGVLNVDTSRYANLSQIPNLGIGLMVTDNEKADNGGAWMVTDYTGDNTYRKDEDGANRDDSSQLKARWNNGATHTVIARRGGIDSYSNAGDRGVKYAGAWNRSISSGITTYSFKTFFVNSDSDHSLTTVVVDLKTNQYNKSKLRSTLNTITAQTAIIGFRDDFDSRYYDTTDDTWTNFVNAYKAAFRALTLVDGTITNPDTLAQNLVDAANALKIKVTLHGNGADTTYYSKTVGFNELTSVNVADFGIPSRKGYTFKGWTLTANDGSAADGILSGQLKVGPRQKDVYATWSLNDYTVTFKAMPYGKFGASSSDTVIHYNVKSTFTVPENYSRDYYIFNNTWKIVSTDSSDWEMGLSLNPGYTSTVGKIGNIVLEPNVTPIQYTVSYDSADGSNIEDTSVMMYNIESTHSLPVSTRQGYKLVGWQVVTTDDEKWNKDTTYAAGYKFTGMHGNVSLKAVWETMTSTVTLNIGADESISGNTVLTYAYSSSLALNTPSKKGYTFKGWRVTATGDGDNTWKIGDEYLLAAGETSVTLPGGKLGDVTLTPIWEINTYTVNFNSDGGTAYDAKTFTVTDSFTLPSPEKNGYTFAGWSVPIHDTEYNWTDVAYYGNQTLTGMYGSVTLKANWTKTPYTVTFDANGGTVSVASLPYDIESGTPNLPTPAKTGYEFDCWVADSTDAQSSWTNGAEYTDALPAGNYGSLTLKAQWKPVKYTINFSDGTTKTYTIEDTFTLPESAKDGYEFVKWTLTSNNGNWGADGTEYTAGTQLSGMWGAAVLQAEYAPCSYTVTYLDTDGSEIAAQGFKTGDEITLEDYSKDGYNFIGWSVKESDGNWGSVGGIITDRTVAAKYGDVTLEPKLEAIEYTVTFVPDGGDAVPSVNYTAEDTLTMPSTAKYGYDFVGWTVETAVGSWTVGETFAADADVTGKWGSVTLKAKWTPKKYNITFIMGDRTEVVQSEYGKASPTLPGDYSKPADAQYTYTFDYWEPALAKVTGEATYTAVYKKELNSYTVTWRVLKTEGGTDWEETTAQWKYGEEPKFDGVPTQNANSTDHRMRFAGWTPEVTPVTGDVTYTAVFESIENPQTVEWYNGSTLLASTEWAKNETPSYSGAVPARADEGGYKFVFVGWAASENGEKLDTIPTVETVSNNPVKYYAAFEKQPQSYTLTLDTDGGTISGGSTVNYTYGGENTVITLPSPVKDGYSFKGWIVTSANGAWTVGDVYGAGANHADVYGSASLKAQWELVEYTLTFDGEGASVESMTYTIESTAALPTAEKEGCELIGWLVSAADGSWTLGTSISTDFILTGSYGSATLTPVYRAKTYKIMWVSGEYVQTSEVQFGSVIFAFEPVSKQGYTAEWDAEIPATMPAEDLTFTAVYKPIEYFLRLELNGGTGAESFYYTFDGDAALPTPTRDGATFDGWRVVSSNGNWTVGTVLAGGTVLTGRYGSTTLLAQWQLEIHTVTWVAGDETRVTRWYHGMTPSFDGTPYKATDENYSYVFTGWDKEIVPVTADVTYTAQFDKTERVYTVKWIVDGVTTEQKYSYGDTPVYGGEIPSRPSTSEYDFTFDGWLPEVTEVTADVAYVAQFRVFVKLQGLSLNKSAMFLDINAGESLTANIYPAAASVKDVIWTSSDASVAAVDAYGKVTAVNAGIAVVSASSGDGSFKSYCVVTVSPKLTTYIEITANGVSTTNQKGTAVQLYAAVKPDDATDRTFKWTSDNVGIASVDEFGMVRFNAKGTTTIRVVTTDGYAQGSIEVTVTEQETTDETQKTYTVRFLNLMCKMYLIDDNGNEHTFDSNEVVIVPEGATIRFRPSRTSCYIIANGEQLERQNEYVIENIQKNYIISNSEAEIITPDDSDSASSFMKKLQEFFRKIVEFFRKLFGKK